MANEMMICGVWGWCGYEVVRISGVTDILYLMVVTQPALKCGVCKAHVASAANDSRGAAARSTMRPNWGTRCL